MFCVYREETQTTTQKAVNNKTGSSKQQHRKYIPTGSEALYRGGEAGRVTTYKDPSLPLSGEWQIAETFGSVEMTSCCR